jgi:hypothetical protein
MQKLSLDEPRGHARVQLVKPVLDANEMLCNILRHGKRYKDTHKTSLRPAGMLAEKILSGKNVY